MCAYPISLHKKIQALLYLFISYHSPACKQYFPFQARYFHFTNIIFISNSSIINLSK
jgi:hypothetical protein